MKSLTKKEFEDLLSKVDNKNEDVEVVKKVGAFSNTESYEMFHKDAWACDEDSVEGDENSVAVLTETYMYDGMLDGYTEVEYLFAIDANNPADSLDSLIQECDDILDEEDYCEKCLKLGFYEGDLSINPRVFPMDVDTYCLLRKKYLADLRAELDGRTLDISNKEDWESHID